MNGPWEDFKPTETQEGPWSDFKSSPAVEEPMSLSGLASNAMSDVGDIAKGGVELAKQSFLAPFKASTTLFKTGQQLAQGQPLAETELGQAPGKLGNMVVGMLPHPNPEKPLSFKNMEPGALLENVTHPYQHPVKAAMDIATVAAPFLPEMKASGLAGAAEKAGVNALGFKGSALNTEQKIAKAQQVARNMLDQGIITPLASHEKMAERASALANRAGSQIGNYLESVGERGQFYDPNEAIHAFEQLRPMGKNGNVLKGGIYDKVNSKIDDAVETLKAHGDEPISFDDANDLKGVFQDNANWKSNKDATLLDRVIAGKFRESIDNALSRISDTGLNKEEYQNFLKNKKLYSSAMQAQDPLYNKVSRELANNKIGLTDLIIAAPEVAAGHSLTGLALVGAKKLAQKFGSQTLASGLNKASKVNIPGAIFKAGAAAKILDESTIAKYMAENDYDPKKAAQAAEADGHSW